jgi:hypothetical protein
VDQQPPHRPRLALEREQLKDATRDGMLLGSGNLATELDRLDLIDEYKLSSPVEK